MHRRARTAVLTAALIGGALGCRQPPPPQASAPAPLAASAHSQAAGAATAQPASAASTAPTAQPPATAASAAPQVKPTGRIVTVRIANMKFVPASLTVHLGDTVVWKNEDLVPHTVVGGAFMSQPIAANQSFRWTADKQGTFPYVCTLHPGMRATLTVK